MDSTITEGVAIDEINRVEEIGKCRHRTCVDHRDTTLRWILAGTVNHDSIVWSARACHERHEGKRTGILAEICEKCQRAIAGGWGVSPTLHDDEGRPIGRAAYCKCEGAPDWNYITRTEVREIRARLRATHGLDDVIGTGSRAAPKGKGGAGPERQD